MKSQTPSLSSPFSAAMSMWRLPAAVVLCVASGLAPVAHAQAVAAPPTLTLDRIFSDPPLQGRVPRQAEVSPGGGWVSFLRPSALDSEQLELWAQPSAGGAPRRLASAADLLGGKAQKLTEAEAMALERQRISQRGITGYKWCGQADRALLFPLSGDLYLLRVAPPDADPAASSASDVPQAAAPQRLTFDDQVPEQDPACSPDGRQVAYVKGGNLWVQPVDGGAARALTQDATKTAFYGLAEFIAAEELERQRGYWWSPDGQHLLVLKVDEGAVPVKVRAQIYADHTAMTEQRYPGAGQANAKVTAFVFDAASGQRIALPLPADAEYIARAGWFDDGAPWLQVLTRDQKRLTLLEFDRRTGAPRTVTEERDGAWVDLNDDLAEVKGLKLSGLPALLWSSEQSGRRQLLLIDRVTGARRPLTAQPEPVDGLVCTDGERVVFSGAADRGRARELFVADLAGHVQPLAGAAPRQWRDAKGDHDCKRLLVTRSGWGEPPQLSLRDVAPGTGRETAGVPVAGDAPDPLLARLVPAPQVVDIVAADGQTPLNAFYFPPVTAAAAARNPVLALAYGGPTGQTVAWRWSGDTALIAYWQRRGLGVFMVDTRGMAGRDRSFTRAHLGAFGRVEVDDLFAAVRQLPQRVPAVDATRIGFFGWSYGGFLAVRSMLDANTPFAAAAAGAPPTDWTLYDTAYTERYLGLPQQSDGSESVTYRDANLVSRAALLTKPLLLLHGTADDNVLFENSLRLIEALENEGRPFDLAIYPGKAHGVSGKKARLHVYRTIDAFFTRHLQLAP